MSNKTRLQTNNTNLDALIARVNAAKDVAASLPEASGGSGGIEVCNITIVEDGPCEYFIGSIYYTAPDGSVAEITQAFKGEILSVMKNTLLAFSGEGLTGNLTYITDYAGMVICHITGDCSLKANA